MRSHVLTYVALIACTVLSCAPDAPHDNPLDPSSPGFVNSGSVRGTVVLMSDPRIAIPAAEVMLAPSGPVFLSDASGLFIITNLPAGSATVIASKAGFWADTLTFTVPVGASLPLEIQLDALPVITQGKIITEKLDEYFPGPTYRAKISADIGDPDGLADLDSVSQRPASVVLFRRSRVSRLSVRARGDDAVGRRRQKLDLASRPSRYRHR